MAKAASAMLSTVITFLAVVPGELWAEDTSSRVLVLDPVLVTARGRSSNLSATPGGTGLIVTEQIAAEQPLSLTNITARLPGVTKASDSAWGSAVNIRGLSRNRVLFLVDGARVNTATDINAQFGTVNPSDIQRIEVLKGPVSSLYGSGSVGGVVNVLTKGGSFDEDARWHGELSNSYQTGPSGPNTYGNLAYAKGTNETRAEALSFVPPLNGLAGMRFDGESGVWGRIETEWAANQGDVAASEARTDRWMVLNADLGYGIEAGKARHEIVLSADNLFGTDYRNHLSTSRGFELREPGRDLQVTWRVLF